MSDELERIVLERYAAVEERRKRIREKLAADMQSRGQADAILRKTLPADENNDTKEEQ